MEWYESKKKKTSNCYTMGAFPENPMEVRLLVSDITSEDIGNKKIKVRKVRPFL